MSASQLVSVRLDPDDVKEIDRWVAGISYRKRSDVIAAGVRLMAELIRRGQADKVIRFWPKWDVIDTFDLQYHREVK